MKKLSRILIFYGFMWFFLILIGGIQQKSGLVPQQMSLPQLAPGLAGLIMLIIFRKDRDHIIFVSKKNPPLRYFLALLIPVSVSIIIFFIAATENGTARPSFDRSLLPVLFWIPFGALGEETGWRGYLHKITAPRMRGIASTFVVSLLWTTMHIHFLGRGPVFLLFFFFTIFSYSCFIYVLIQDQEFNVLTATLFHAAINICNLFFIDIINDTNFMIINGSIWLAAAVILIAIKRRELLKTAVIRSSP